MSTETNFLSVTVQATLNQHTERLRLIIAAWTAAGSPDPERDGRWAANMVRELEQISELLQQEFERGTRFHTSSIIRMALDAGNSARNAGEPLDLSRIVESSLFNTNRLTPPPGSDEVEDRDTWWIGLAPMRPSTPGPSKIPVAGASEALPARGRQPLKATADPGTSGRGRQRSKRPESSTQKTPGDTRRTRSRSKGSGLKKAIKKLANVNDGEEEEQTLGVGKRGASSGRGFRSKSRAPSEAEAMEIDEEPSAKGKGRAVEVLEAVAAPAKEEEVDELADDDEADEETAKATDGKKRLDKSGKGKEKERGNGGRSRSRARDGKNRSGFLLNQFYPNPCSACSKADRPCVASRSEMCQRCKKAKVKCERDWVQAMDEDPRVFGNFEKGWDLPPGVAPSVADTVPAVSGPGTRSRVKRQRDASEDDGNSSAPPTLIPAKRRRSVSARSETGVGSAAPPPSSESESSKAPTRASRREIPYIVVPTAEQAYRRKSREAMEELNNRVRALESASRESESTIRGLMATVESMRQLLVQHYGPLSSPLQSSLAWRRSLPPSHSTSRVGSPLAHGTPNPTPGTLTPLEPVAEEHAASVAEMAIPAPISPPPAEDIQMDSASVVHACQEPDPNAQVQSPAADVPSYSTFLPRTRTTSGNRRVSTANLGWGWAVGQPTGGLSSTTGHDVDDTQEKEKQEAENAEA